MPYKKLDYLAFFKIALNMFEKTAIFSCFVQKCFHVFEDQVIINSAWLITLNKYICRSDHPPLHKLNIDTPAPTVHVKN